MSNENNDPKDQEEKNPIEKEEVKEYYTISGMEDWQISLMNLSEEKRKELNDKILDYLNQKTSGDKKKKNTKE